MSTAEAKLCPERDISERRLPGTNSPSQGATTPRNPASPHDPDGSTSLGGSRGCPCERGGSGPSRWDHAVSPGRGERLQPPGYAALSMT